MARVHRETQLRAVARGLDQPHQLACLLLADPYSFETDILHCLDGSSGLITSHGDVRNPRVTWAFASAVAATK